MDEREKTNANFLRIPFSVSVISEEKKKKAERIDDNSKEKKSANEEKKKKKERIDDVNSNIIDNNNSKWFQKKMYVCVNRKNISRFGGVVEGIRKNFQMPRIAEDQSELHERSQIRRENGLCTARGGRT